MPYLDAVGEEFAPAQYAKVAKEVIEGPPIAYGRVKVFTQLY